MANTKISLFPQVLNNDIRQMTSIAGAGNSASASNVNVKISGSSLLNSLEALLDLSSFSTGTLPVLRGGTGATSFTNHGILIGNVSNAISATAELANGELLIGSAGNAPVPATLTAGTGVTVTNGAGSITIANSAPDQTVALTGGTGISTSGTYPNFTITNDSPNQATPAAGSSGQLQYNDGSNGFAATSDMVYTTDQLKVQNSIYLDGNGSSAGIVKLGCDLAGASHYIGLEGPNHSGNTQYNIKFPDATPSANKMLIANSMTGTTANMFWRDMYDANGTLTGARTVTMGAHNLTFAGSGTSKVTFSNLGGVEIARDLTVQKNVIIQGQGYSELHTGATIDGIDWNIGNVQEITLPAGLSDFDPSNPKAGATYILKITQPSGGNGTINWDNIGAANIKWPGGTEPTLTATNAAVDIVTLICTNATGQGVYYANATLNFS